uniref:Single-stranded DNA binding protein n=1 Tax=Nitophyllum punctatum TaxID=158729 RepID=A0A4D6WYB5_9FLOR|nr:hypothetical protein [Nitophyllum punctatum]
MNNCLITVKILYQPILVIYNNQPLILLTIIVLNRKKQGLFGRLITYSNKNLYKYIYNCYKQDDICIISGTLFININNMNSKLQYYNYILHKYLCIQLREIQPCLNMNNNNIESIDI